MHNLSGTGLLVGTDKGLFLARSADGLVTLEPTGNGYIGNVLAIDDLPGVGVLIGADKGLFLIRSADRLATVEPVGTADTGMVWALHNLSGAGVLIGSDKGLFLARSANGLATIEPAGGAGTGRVLALHKLPGAEVLVRADKGSFLARSTNGTVSVKRVYKTDIGFVHAMHDLAGAGVLIGAEGGLFVARSLNGAYVERLDNVDTGYRPKMEGLPGAGILIAGDKGLFLARSVNGTVIVDPVGKGDTGNVYALRDLPGVGTLIGAQEGLFLARSLNGLAAVEPAGNANTGAVSYLQDLPGAGVLIGAERGLFLAWPVNGTAFVEPAGRADIGALWQMLDFPGQRELIVAQNGWFVVRSTNAAAIVEPAPGGDVSVDILGPFHELPGAGILIGASGTPNQLFLASTMPLERAHVALRDLKTLGGSAARPDADLNFVFTVGAHACASAADKLNLRLSVTPPERKPIEPKIEPQSVRYDQGIAAVAFPVRIDKAGEWSFRLMSKFGGAERPVGEPQLLTFTSVGLRAWLEKLAWWLAGIFALVLSFANAVLFLLARRSAWAWRLATDDGLGTALIRVGTLALSHFRVAQIWILDLYFRRRRLNMSAAAPFLSLPLTSGDGKVEASERALTPPWTGKRLWVQGGSGMGKTALFRHVTNSHFRDHHSAFAASATWGCVVVAFSARDFTDTAEDKDDPAWVVNAVRATLSGHRLTFSDEKLLSRFLESGSIGVAIDGLNEVDRSRAVTAFARSFDAAPMLVTSQQSGDERYFTSWRLPQDIRAFTDDLLREYLSEHAAAAVMRRISASGLKDAIRSGYDVRLIIDLVQPDPERAVLPTDRLGLYEAVVIAGWPKVTEETRREQLNRIAAAAWRMVSERKANEDMRRLKPDADLAGDLLVALADAPERDRKPVRLIRRAAGGAFEFVHDQMHAYLAARWFTQEGFSLAELYKMVETSTIWAQAPDARRTLWGFVATLLDDERLIALWTRVEDKEECDTLRRALKSEAERRGLEQPKAPKAKVSSASPEVSDPGVGSRSSDREEGRTDPGPPQRATDEPLGEKLT